MTGRPHKFLKHPVTLWREWRNAPAKAANDRLNKLAQANKLLRGDALSAWASRDEIHRQLTSATASLNLLQSKLEAAIESRNMHSANATNFLAGYHAEKRRHAATKGKLTKALKRIVDVKP